MFPTRQFASDNRSDGKEYRLAKDSRESDDPKVIAVHSLGGWQLMAKGVRVNVGIGVGTRYPTKGVVDGNAVSVLAIISETLGVLPSASAVANAPITEKREMKPNNPPDFIGLGIPMPNHFPGRYG